MIKVSVIVPIYNVEKYLGKLVDSLIMQTLKEIEIILVDDGSPDNCGLICDQYARKDNRVKVIHKKNGGVSAARNDGLSSAKGDFVIFCDSDDWLPLDALELLWKKAMDTDADIVIGDVYQYKKGQNIQVRFYKEDFVTEEKEFIHKMIQADIYRTYCPLPPQEGPAFGYGGPWNKLVRRSLLIENNIQFDIRVKGLYDDILYTAYILANAKRIAYITQPVYYYRIIQTSITMTYKPNALEINNAIFNSWDEFIVKYDKFGILKEPFYANVIRRFTETLPIYFCSKKNPKSTFEIVKEIQNVIDSEPYKTAAKLAKGDVFCPKMHRVMQNMINKRSAWGVYIAYKLLSFKNKILKKE